MTSLSQPTMTNLARTCVPNLRPRRLRNGVTLMEVIFAIGIILTGLVGLAALIPVAAENAKATMELDRSVNESTSAVATGIARNLVDLDSLVIFDKAAKGSLGNVPTTLPQTLRWKVEIQPSPAVSPPPGPIGKLDPPGYSHHGRGDGLMSAICIDPLGMPDPRLIGAIGSNNLGTPATDDNAFEYSRFPYYSESYNVLAPPNLDSSTGGSLTPRMWRATLVWDMQDNGAPPVAANEIMPQVSLARIFRGFGGVSVVGGPEVDEPNSVLLGRTRIGSSYFDASREAPSKYSWFMTLTPPFLGGSTFRQSIVIVESRTPPVPQRLRDPTEFELTWQGGVARPETHDVEDAKDNPFGERLTWIGQSIGFADGAGGDVLLYGSEKVSDEIKVGQWVLLSRQPYAGVPLAPTGPAVHRWFQVLGVDDAEYGRINGTFGEPNWTSSDQSVWRRWVTLAGSDWSFGFQTTNNLRDDTYCTIVTGAVNVFDSEVVVE